MKVKRSFLASVDSFERYTRGILGNNGMQFLFYRSYISHYQLYCSLSGHDLAYYSAGVSIAYILESLMAAILVFAHGPKS